ncbi:hypothetical protein F4779DRAFT_383312 [Xylariaceae sp. FL0662B]|nr:hypothetical protein F4779DRAFT_383312 [Xylariaceae sp. FL0662B]
MYASMGTCNVMYVRMRMDVCSRRTRRERLQAAHLLLSLTMASQFLRSLFLFYFILFYVFIFFSVYLFCSVLKHLGCMRYIRHAQVSSYLSLFVISMYCTYIHTHIRCHLFCFSKRGFFSSFLFSQRLSTGCQNSFLFPFCFTLGNGSDLS